MGAVTFQLDRVGPGEFAAPSAVLGLVGRWSGRLVVQRVNAYDVNDRFELVVAEVAAPHVHDVPAAFPPRRVPLDRVTAGAILAIPGHAQDRGAEARLDDFALPEAKPALGVEQLTAQDPSELPQQRVDRALAQPLQTDATGAMPAQISSEDTGGAVVQLPSARESRLSLGTAVSHTSDSAPRTAGRRRSVGMKGTASAGQSSQSGQPALPRRSASWPW